MKTFTKIKAEFDEAYKNKEFLEQSIVSVNGKYNIMIKNDEEKS